MAQISALLCPFGSWKDCQPGKNHEKKWRTFDEYCQPQQKLMAQMVLIPSAHPLMSLLCHYPRFNHNKLIQFFSSTVFVYLSFPNYLFQSSLGQLLEKGPVAAKKSLCHPHLFFWLQVSVSWEKTFRNKVDSCWFPQKTHTPCLCSLQPPKECGTPLGESIVHFELLLSPLNVLNHLGEGPLGVPKKIRASVCWKGQLSTAKLVGGFNATFWMNK